MHNNLKINMSYNLSKIAEEKGEVKTQTIVNRSVDQLAFTEFIIQVQLSENNFTLINNS